MTKQEKVDFVINTLKEIHPTIPVFSFSVLLSGDELVDRQDLLPLFLEILKAYHDCGYEGYIRPDHGRHLWNEGPGNVRPGYGLYDRALGIMYMLGVRDMLDRIKEGK